MPHSRYEMAKRKIHKSEACGFYRFMYQYLRLFVMGGGS